MQKVICKKVVVNESMGSNSDYSEVEFGFIIYKLVHFDQVI